MSYKLLYLPLQARINQLNTEIKRVMHQSLKREHRHYIRYILKNKGKKLRSLLSLSIFEAYSSNKKDRKKSICIISAIEMIHLASLIHDDVIDEADARRGELSVNAKWGNSNAVALGTYIYATALKQIYKGQDLEVLKHFSSVVKTMCEGELYQLRDRDAATFIGVRRYYRIIYCKTASLFALSTWLGGHLAGVLDVEKNKLKKIGVKLGFLYQYIDDLLDILDDGRALNKNALQDLENGQVTYPLIIYQQLTANQALSLVQLKEFSQQELQVLFKQTGTTQACIDKLNQQKEKLLWHISQLSHAEIQSKLKLMLSFMVERVPV
eukprot:COSAG01_NODE_662_length_14431_cov_31.385775_3_plen_324_part_00